jgi:hypothetical protein
VCAFSGSACRQFSACVLALLGVQVGVEEVSPCMQKLVVMILHACLIVEPKRVSVLPSRVAERSGGWVSASHGSVWLFKECNQVMLKVPSGVNNLEVLCCALVCSVEKNPCVCVFVPTVLLLFWAVERAECCE